ncbi:MAG TPA: c-type cytochrome [Terriglobales bacterium]|jgi:mono/diheme cytochrome c family protein
MTSFKNSLCAAVLALLALGLAAQQRGPIEQQHVDPASAVRGQALYRTSCASCHGPRARGTAAGVDLIRSTIIQHDLYGSTLGPFLHQGHAPHPSGLSTAQVLDLSNFLHQEFDATLSRSPAKPAPDILVGDAAAGQAWFNGAGQCSTCHSTSGDLAGIATRYADPYALQQRFVFPGGFHRGGSAAEAKRTVVTVTITSAAGPPVTGDLVNLDDFTIVYRDAQGHTQTVQRTPGMTVTEHNPLAYHEGLLKTMTDRQMHNMLAYLETLK